LCSELCKTSECPEITYGNSAHHGRGRQRPAQPGAEPLTSIAAAPFRPEIDKSLDVAWSIFNDRIAKDEDKDPPVVRYKDAKKFATNRLGPFAERHLGWGRASVLSRLGDVDGGLSLQLAEAARAARAAFKSTPKSVFQKSVDRAAALSKRFSVPIRGTYTAELDVQGVNITSGGVALHDDSLPLRRLGCGSARLIVAAFQHDSGPPHVALIDEIEHGLEPLRS